MLKCESKQKKFRGGFTPLLMKVEKKENGQELAQFMFMGKVLWAAAENFRAGYKILPRNFEN